MEAVIGEGKPIKINNSALYKKAFTHIYDVVDCLIRLINIQI